MEKIALFTQDPSLRTELSGILPKGFRVSPRVFPCSNAIIFFDMDTIRVGLIGELHEKNFVIAVTKRRRTDPAMEATTFGAYEIIHRPLTEDTVIQLLEELRDLGSEIRQMIPVTGNTPIATCAIVGHSPVIMDVCKKLARLSQVDAPVLIMGETGTGKELIAESIAQLSTRFGKPFVVVNCAAVPETLLESELFGFEKGSFTGALAAKEGMLKIADEGCVFFDEVGELPPPLQGKLLRFLQTQAFYPIGSTKEIQVNVRVISATNRDLSAMVREGKFREDLYHRLRVTTIHIPPLREHKEDILPLVHFFLNRYRHTAPRPIKGISKAFFKKMTAYDWPGNIREVENAIRSALALSKTNCLSTYDLKELVERSLSKGEAVYSETIAAAVVHFAKRAMEKREKNVYKKIHNEVDRPLLEYVLTYAKGSQSEAARILGINRLTLRKKLRY